MQTTPRGRAENSAAPVSNGRTSARGPAKQLSFAAAAEVEVSTSPIEPAVRATPSAAPQADESAPAAKSEQQDQADSTGALTEQQGQVDGTGALQEEADAFEYEMNSTQQVNESQEDTSKMPAMHDNGAFEDQTEAEDLKAASSASVSFEEGRLGTAAASHFLSLHGIVHAERSSFGGRACREELAGCTSIARRRHVEAWLGMLPVSRLSFAQRSSS